MNTKLILYKNNLIDNYNFTVPNNKKISNDGITTDDIWLGIGGDWNIINNQCVINTITSYNTFSTQKILKVNTQYYINIQLTISGSLNVYVGDSVYNITTSGVHSFTLDTLTSTQVEFEMVSGTCAIDWVKCFEYPHVYEIDLTNDVTVPLNFSIADIKDISKRNASYSKTVNIPATKNNNKFFDHIYEISGMTSFNANKKCRAIIEENGIVIFDGVLKLNKINRDINYNYNNIIDYEVTLLGKVADIFTEMADIKLSDLDYTEYNHIYNKANQKASWDSYIYLNGATYSNWINSTPINISSITNYSEPSGERLQLNLSGTHSFVADDQVLLTVNTGDKQYEGDHVIYATPNNTTLVLNYPYDFTSSSTLTGTIMKHEPTGEGYVYSMVNRGRNDGNTWNVKDFTVNIFAKTYLDKIFKKVGFRYNSQFLTSNIFKRLVIPFNKKDIKYSKAETNNRLFRVSNTNGHVYNYQLRPTYSQNVNPQYYYHSVFSDVSNSPYNIQIPIKFDDETSNINYDNGNNFNITNYSYTCPVTSNYNLYFILKTKKYWTLPSGVTEVPTNNWNVSDKIILWDLTLNSQVGAVNIGNQTMNSQSVNYNTLNASFNNCQLIQGHQYQLRLQHEIHQTVKFYNTATYNPMYPNLSPNYTGNIDCVVELSANGIFYNTSLAEIQEENTMLNMNNVSIDMTAKEFMKNITTMFNLYIEPDKTDDRLLNIEPRNSYYEQGETLDWTDKLDISKQFNITPLGDITNKKYIYTYKDDKDALNKDHLDNFKITYGNYTYNIDNEFVQGELKNEITFSPSPLNEYPSTSKRVIASFVDDKNVGIDVNYRILYYSLRSGLPSNYTYTSTQGNTTEYKYPYAGHMDNTECPNFDLNFWYPINVYYTYDSWTSKNIFNKFHKNQLEEIVDPDSKLIDCYLYLNAKDIGNLNFKNTYIINNHHLRLNKVSDYIVGNGVSTQCTFVKIFDTQRFIGSNTFKVIDNNSLDGLSDVLPSANRISTTNNINGFGNNVSSDSYNVFISGNYNTIESNSDNINLIGSNYNTISGSNVNLFNTNNQNITESNISIINGVIYYPDGSTVNLNFNYINCGVDDINPIGAGNNYINCGYDDIEPNGLKPNFIDAN